MKRRKAPLAERRPRQGTNLQIRLSLEQHRILSQRAAMSGLSTSSWVRMKVLEIARREEGR